MYMLKVLDIGTTKTIKTQFGDKPKVNLKVEELSTHQVYENAGYFIPKDGLFFKIGDEITGELEVNGKYTNLKNLAPVKKETPPPPPANGNGDDEVDWDGKELRGHRRACLAIAASMLTEEQKNKLGATDVEVVGMVQLTADKLLAYVYGKEDKFSEQF